MKSKPMYAIGDRVSVPDRLATSSAGAKATLFRRDTGADRILWHDSNFGTTLDAAPGCVALRHGQLQRSPERRSVRKSVSRRRRDV